MCSDGCYLICDCATESMEHVLWACPMANDVWVASQIRVLKWDRSVQSFCNLLMMARSRLNVEEFEAFGCLAYFIWHQRNKLVHEGCLPNANAVVERVSHLHHSFRDARS